MKIRTQLDVTMALFGLLLLVILAFVINAVQETARLERQIEMAEDIERTVSELGYLSNDYLLYRESRQRARWEAKFASLSGYLSALKPNSR